MADISFNIASKELKIAQIAQLNQLFKLLHLVHIVCFHMSSRAAILASQNNETVAMLVSKTNPRGVELFSYANAFFCSNKFAKMLAT